MAQIKAIFFQECDEQLAELETGLLALRRGDAEPEQVNTAFRAAHSIKGGAAAFGLDALVRFAHRMESVLADIRSGRLATGEEVVGTLLAAADVLADLVRAERGAGSASVEAASVMEAKLASLTGASSADIAVPTATATGAQEPAVPSDGETEWIVCFRPRAGLYAKANEPLLLLRELAQLGALDVTLNDMELPPLQDLNPEDSYLSWETTLRTGQSEAAIREVFEFVEGECDLELRPALRPRQETDSAGTSSRPDIPSVRTGDDAAALNPPAAAQTASAGAVRSAFNDTIRVDLERVDRLINLASELVVHEAILAQRLSNSGMLPDSDVEQALDELHHLTRELQDSVMSVRAQSVKPVFQRMSRVVRELETATGKQVELICEGESTEVDRTVIERLTDPLTHMIRNAVDHGIETPEVRRRAGKPPRGTIRISACHRAGRVVIEVQDDGGGIDRARVRAIAQARGIIAANDMLADHEMDNLIFVPGFSTASTVSELSGRGVGMDVVKKGVHGLGGRISVASRPGEGSTFTLSLPLTLAVLDGMLITVCGQTLIVPLTCLLETIQPQRGNVHRLGANTTVLTVRDRQLPLIDLGASLNYRAAGAACPQGIVLLVEDDQGREAALLVDDVGGQHQVVIKSVQANYRAVPGIAAATILGDGRVALIVDVNAVLASEGRRSAPAGYLAETG